MSNEQRRSPHPDCPTHEELRRWGYQAYVAHGSDGEPADDGLPTYVDVPEVLKCLSAFPSDYFPLRIAHSIETALRDIAATTSPYPEEVPFDATLVLTARKTACLYHILNTARAITNPPDRVQILSDRFLYLKPNKPALKRQHIRIVDDLSRRGIQLNRRATNLRDHIEKFIKTESEVEKVALIDVAESKEDAQHFRQISEADGAGLIRAYARTMAKANLPYYADFPVLKKLNLDEGQLRALFGKLDRTARYEVSSSVGMDERVRSYTYNLASILPNSKLLSRINRHCDITKLRVFVSSPKTYNKDGGEEFSVRLVIKPLLRRQHIKCVCSIAHRLNILSDKDQPTNLQICQAFGYIQYLLSWLLVDELRKYLSDGVKCGERRAVASREVGSHGCQNISIDTEFARLVLGKDLYDHAEQQIAKKGETSKQILDILDKNVPAHDEIDDTEHSSATSSTSPDADRRSSTSFLVGDDLATKLDHFISKRTRIARNRVSSDNTGPRHDTARDSSQSDQDQGKGSPVGEDKTDWKRLNFHELSEHLQEIGPGEASAAATDDSAHKPEEGAIGHASAGPENTHSAAGIDSRPHDLLAALVIDVLTDWGKIVPDQQVVDDDKLKKLPADRPANAEPRCDIATPEENHYVERCFRAGEITAVVNDPTLTGGKICLSRQSKKYVPASPSGAGEETSETHSGRLENWTPLDVSQRTDDQQQRSELFALPQDVCHSLYQVLECLREAIEQLATSADPDNTTLTDLAKAVKKLRNEYFSLPCPLVSIVDSPEDIEFAWDVLHEFYGDDKLTPGSEPRRRDILLLNDDDEWHHVRSRLDAIGTRWGFRLFHRIKRAVLAVDTLLAILCPILWSHPEDGPKRNHFRVLDHDSCIRVDSDTRHTSDVWEDWTVRLDGPPTSLQYLHDEVLDDNLTDEAIFAAFRDLAGDVWHAVTHAAQPMLLEIDSKADAIISHRLRLQCVISSLSEQVCKYYDTYVKNKDWTIQIDIKQRVLETWKHPQFSPFGGNVLLTAEDVVRRDLVYNSHGIWVPFNESSLRTLVNSGKVIEVVDWQGTKRYPSFQFVPFCLREGMWLDKENQFVPPARVDIERHVRFTDPDYPFLRRDIAEAMAQSSLSVSGWAAALWFGQQLEDLSDDSTTQQYPTFAQKQGRQLGYRGLAFSEALSQKGLWIDHWLADGRTMFPSSLKLPEPSKLEGFTYIDSDERYTLYRITESRYTNPHWWASSAPFKTKLDMLRDYRHRSITNRHRLHEPTAPAGRFDPGSWRTYNSTHSNETSRDRDFGALYLSSTVRGCVLEVFDRQIAIFIDDVTSRQVYIYEAPKGTTCRDISDWPSHVFSTPIRSTTQAIADCLCYDLDAPAVNGGDSRILVYPLRTSANERGIVFFEPTCLGPDETKLSTSGESPADHNPKVPELNRGRTEPWQKSRSYWKAIASLANPPRDSVLCLRRFPPSEFGRPKSSKQSSSERKDNGATTKDVSK